MLKKADLRLKDKEWFYSKKVKEHFFNPKNFVKGSKEAKKLDKEADGVGLIGEAICGDVMRMWIKVKDDRIIECRWMTMGCASAIASTSMLSVMVTENKSMKIDDALKIKPDDIMKRLEGLPAIKYHCSVLGDKSLREAINDYFRKTKQFDRIVGKKERIIDKKLKITEYDIEEAVKAGAKTFEELQEKTKICVADKSCINEAKQLFRFYKEKYYGKD